MLQPSLLPARFETCGWRPLPHPFSLQAACQHYRPFISSNIPSIYTTALNNGSRCPSAFTGNPSWACARIREIQQKARGTPGGGAEAGGEQRQKKERGSGETKSDEFRRGSRRLHGPRGFAACCWHSLQRWRSAYSGDRRSPASLLRAPGGPGSRRAVPLPS